MCKIITEQYQWIERILYNAQVIIEISFFQFSSYYLLYTRSQTNFLTSLKIFSYTNICITGWLIRKVNASTWEAEASECQILRPVLSTQRKPVSLNKRKNERTKERRKEGKKGGRKEKKKSHANLSIKDKEDQKTSIILYLI